MVLKRGGEGGGGPKSIGIQKYDTRPLALSRDDVYKKKKKGGRSPRLPKEKRGRGGKRGILL